MWEIPQRNASPMQSCGTTAANVEPANALASEHEHVWYCNPSLRLGKLACMVLGPFPTTASGSRERKINLVRFHRPSRRRANVWDRFGRYPVQEDHGLAFQSISSSSS